MKVFLLTILIFAGTFRLFAQSEIPQEAPSKRVTKYLSEFCSIIKKNALYADSLNWAELNERVKALSYNKSKIEDCRPIIDTIMFALFKSGDKHSIFLPKEKSKNLVNNNTSSGNIQPESYLLDSNIAYVKVPAFLSINLKASEDYANLIQQDIERLDKNHDIKGWIVDLRNNTGGNMHPMIKGLSPLIGNEICGYVVNPKRGQSIPVSPTRGQTGKIKLKSEYHILNPDIKIAVLIDSNTGSSGEFTAIAFKGLSNVKFFGQPSAGYTTSNYSYPLSDGSYLFLATAYMADRNKKMYLPNIVPDTITSNDTTVTIAKQWLIEK